MDFAGRLKIPADPLIVGNSTGILEDFATRDLFISYGSLHKKSDGDMFLEEFHADFSPRVKPW